MDSSWLTKRRQNKTIANDFINRLNRSTTSYGPQAGISSDSIINQVVMGQMKDIQKCEGAFRMDSGCPCEGNYRTSSSVTPYTGQWITFMFKDTGDVPFTGTAYVDGIVTDPQDNIYVTGTYTASVEAVVQNVNGFTQTPSLITLPAITGIAVNYGFIIKYDTNGIAQWATSMRASSFMSPASIGIDSNNDIYITGVYLTTTQITLDNALGNGQTPSLITLPPPPPSNATPSIFTVKYNAAGQAQWATYFDGDGVPDFPAGLAVDSANNVYITGQYTSTAAVQLQNAAPPGQAPSPVTLPTTTSTDIYLVKYNSAGQVQWATLVNGNGFDTANDVATDANGNVYLTGNYVRVGPALQLLNANGNTISPFQVTSSYILNTTGGNPYSFVIKYNSQGQIQWATYTTSDTDNMITRSLVCDSAMNVYVLGDYSSSNLVLPSVTIYQSNGFGQTNSSITLPTVSSQLTFLLKYNATGQAQWATFLRTNQNQLAYAIAIDSQSNLYLTGEYRSTVADLDIYNASGITQNQSAVTLPLSSTGNAYIVKYNSIGEVQWATFLSTPGAGDTGTSIVLNSYDNLLVGGYMYLGSTQTDVYNANGNTVPPFQVITPYNVPANNGTGVSGSFLMKFV
jgi:hypothetical protein